MPTMRSPLQARRRATLLAVWLGLAAALAQAQSQPADAPLATPPVVPVPAATSGGDPPVVEPVDAPWLNISGFGTLGWARSNRDWTYQRFINRRGGLERDSVFGAQADLRLDDTWSATIQAKLAPSESNDRAWRVTPAWAFIAWRPANDWLLRAGKLRIPIFLHSEQLDVGATYDEARLPADIYGIVPTTDFKGLRLTRSWAITDGDLSLDAYHGKARQSKRVWVREGLPGLVSAGAMFREVNTQASGLVATWNDSSTKARIGLHRVLTSRRGGSALPVRPTWVDLGPGIGYWQTESELPGPGIATVQRIENTMLTLGTEFSPLPGWKVIGEYGRLRQVNTERSVDSTGGYVTLSREIAAFTPYVTLSRLFSSSVSREWTRRLDETTVPAVVPGAGLLNASMRISADSVPVYDQWSQALGGSYALSPTHKLKAEWMRTRAKAPGMYDLPSGAKLFQRRSVDVLSLSYSFVF